MENNISCIIVDDEQDAIDLLTHRLTMLFKNIRIVASYTQWEEALEALRSLHFDLLFMDISMPGKNGIELLKLLPGLDSEIIFVTAHEKYALNAFSFKTSGYLLKPVDDAELSNALNKAIERVITKRRAKQASNPSMATGGKLGIPNNHGIDYVNIPDILYLESTNKCTKIVTAKSEYISSLNLGKFVGLVRTHSFFQVHRSYIINLNAILRYESSGLVIMSNKKEIPVSRNTRSEFLRLFDSDLL